MARSEDDIDTSTVETYKDNVSQYDASGQYAGTDYSAAAAAEYDGATEGPSLADIAKARRESANKEMAGAERLFTVRSRAGMSSFNNRNERGTIARIKLLTTSADKTKSRIQGKSSTQDASLSISVDDLLNDKFSNFLLTNISFQMSEKVQVMSVFGDAEVAYFFGRQPMRMNLSGMLIDSPDNNWFVEFLTLYEKVLRGTRLAQNHELLQITLPNAVLIGSIDGVSYQQDASRDTDIPFSISVLVKQYIPKASDIASVAEDLSKRNAVFNKGMSKRTTTASINKLRTKFGTGTVDPAKVKLPGFLGDVAAGLGSAEKSLKSGTKSATQGGQQGVASVTDPVLDSLAAMRVQLVSPVFGIVSSITKVVKSTNDSNGILGQLTSPIKNVLNEVTSIYNMGADIYKEVDAAGKTLKNLEKNLKKTYKNLFGNFKKNIKNINKTMGSASRRPVSGSTILMNSNRLKSVNSLKASLSGGVSKKGAAILSALNKAQKKASDNTL